MAKLVAVHAMKLYGRVAVQIQSFLTDTLNVDEQSVSRSGRLTQGEETQVPATYWIGDWVDLTFCKVALRKRRNSPSGAIIMAALPPSTPAITAPKSE